MNREYEGVLGRDSALHKRIRTDATNSFLSRNGLNKVTASSIFMMTAIVVITAVFVITTLRQMSNFRTEVLIDVKLCREVLSQTKARMENTTAHMFKSISIIEEILKTKFPDLFE